MLKNWWNQLPKGLTLEVSEFTKDIPELERCEFHHLFVCDDLQRGRRNHHILRDAQWVVTAFTEAQFHCWNRAPDPVEKKPNGTKEEENTYVGHLNVATSAWIDPETKEKKERFLGYFYNIPTTPNRLFVPSDRPPFTVGEPVIVPLPKKDQNDTTECPINHKWNNRLDHWAKIKGELWKVKASHLIELDIHMQNGVLFKRQRVPIEVPLKCLHNGTVDRNIYDQEAFMYIGLPKVWEDQIDGGYLFKPMTIFSSPSLSRRYYSYTNLEENE